MRVYDLVMNKMTVENGIRDNTALKNFAGDENNNCSGASNYFKISQGSGCVFKTSDGVWWDISDINRVIIALNQNDLNKDTADSDTNRAFYLLSWFDNNGNLRVDDLAAAEGENKTTISKLYDFISGKTSTSKAEVANGGNNVNVEANVTDIFYAVKNGDIKQCEIIDCGFECEEINHNNCVVMSSDGGGGLDIIMEAYDSNGDMYKEVSCHATDVTDHDYTSDIIQELSQVNEIECNE